MRLSLITFFLVALQLILADNSLQPNEAQVSGLSGENPHSHNVGDPAANPTEEEKDEPFELNRNYGAEPFVEQQNSNDEVEREHLLSSHQLPPVENHKRYR